ncbi:MAG: large subunit ribosomal protein L10 [Cellvibrionaceae bacterium]
MALAFEDKVQIVAEVSEIANNALSLVIADARGVSTTDMTILRKQARDNSIQLLIIRNTLAKRAFAKTEFECVSEALIGPSLFGFSMEDPGAAARVFKEFAKKNNNFEVKALSAGGKLLASSQIDTLAKLPTRDQALGMLASVMIAPVIKLVRTCNEVPTKVVRAVAAVRDQKQEAA